MLDKTVFYQEFDKSLAEYDFTITLSLNGKNIGYIDISVEDNSAEIMVFEINKEYRSKGYGRIFLTHAVNRLYYHGFRDFKISAISGSSDITNENLLKFYDSIFRQHLSFYNLCVSEICDIYTLNATLN